MKIEVFFKSENNQGNSVVDQYREDEGCHNLAPFSKLDTPYPGQSWKYIPKMIFQSQYISGPASLIHSRVIVYPCNLGRCRIVCPCFICRGKDERNGISSPQENFEDHHLHHKVPHSDCVFCSEFCKNLPCYNYNSIFSHEFKQVKRFKFRSDEIQCDECDHKFKTVVKMKSHFLKTHYEQEFECHACWKRFQRKDKMLRHFDLSHGSEVKLFECHLCGATFKLNADLTRHMRSAIDKDGNQQNSCDCCKKQFCTLRDLQLHTKSNHKRFKCSCCEKNFSTKFNLSVHMKKEKTSCGQCNLRFCNEYAALDHENSTHNEKVAAKVNCENCGKEFSKHWQLRRHKKKNPVCQD